MLEDFPSFGKKNVCFLGRINEKPFSAVYFMLERKAAKDGCFLSMFTL